MDNDRKTELASIPLGISLAAVGILGTLYVTAEALAPDPSRQISVSSLIELIDAVGPMVRMTIDSGISRMLAENERAIGVTLAVGYLSTIVSAFIVGERERLLRVNKMEDGEQEPEKKENGKKDSQIAIEKQKNTISPTPVNNLKPHISGKIVKDVDPYRLRNFSGDGFFANFEEEPNGKILVRRGRDGKIKRKKGSI